MADEPQDRRRTLATRHVVFVVIAAAAPMAAMVGNVPVAFLYGNGPGLPAAFAIAGIALLCFCVGYAAMSRRVVNTGAFYTYVARGIGRPPAVGAAYLAVLSYTALTVGLAGAFGYFIQLGTGLTWEIPSALAIGIVAVLGYRSADLSAKVLGTLMLLEFVILIVFDAAVGIRKGAGALPIEALAPHNVFSGSIGIALMFAFTSFVGFESGALYGEETSNPERSIPTATYIAVASVGIFYFLTTWFAVGSFGVGETHRAAVNAAAQSNDKLGNLLIDQGTKYAGSAFGSIMGLLLCTSVLASMLAVHNASSRYLFALGRERVLPGGLGRFHPKFASPHIGSLTVTAITVVVVGAFAVSGLDPYLNLATSMIGLSTLGVVALQVLAAVSIIAFFRRRGERDYWRTMIFPGIGAIALGAAFVLAIVHYPTLVGTDNPLIDGVPWLLLVAMIGGVITSRWLKRRRPAIYAKIAQSTLRARPRSLATPTEWTRRYCLIGAGPAGLVTARALHAQGIPFHWYAGSSALPPDPDPDAPGTASPEWVDGPMPTVYRDALPRLQMRDHVGALADELRPLVTSDAAVLSVLPAGDGWDVMLSDGSAGHYAGVIAEGHGVPAPRPAIVGSVLTGYTTVPPFVAGDLYLNIFSRSQDGVAVVGFVESVNTSAGAAYQRFEEMAHMIVLDLTARELGGAVRARWQTRKASDRPDLSGGQVGMEPGFVDAETYAVVLADLRDRFGIGAPPAHS